MQMAYRLSIRHLSNMIPKNGKIWSISRFTTSTEIENNKNNNNAKNLKRYGSIKKNGMRVENLEESGGDGN